MIVESFGREYIGGYNEWMENGRYKGYTPFVDSLMEHSMTIGIDLTVTADKDTWAVNYLNGIYQYVKGDYLLQWDGEKTKAVIQSYMDRMTENRLT